VEIKSSLARPVAGKSLRSYIDKYAPPEAFVFNDGLFETTRIEKTAVHFRYQFSKLPGDK
jgi:hypothetical protein